MKGTAPRGRTTAEDREQSRLLRSSSKEQAENLMIVDLLRNDLGRVAEVGSVVVDELFALERYPTVWQMTSEVSARVRPGTGLLDLFRALFPCGSVTGAPKRRTMQLIADLEPTPRGVYCGAVGLVAPPSAAFRARFNVAIRTVVVDRTTGRGRVRRGRRHHLGLRGGVRACRAARQGGRPGPRRDRAPAARDAGVRPRRGAAPSRPPPRPHGRLGRLGGLPLRPDRRRRHRAAGGRPPDRAGTGADPAVPGRGRRRRAARPCRRPAPGRCASRSTTSRSTPPSPWLQHKTTGRDVYLTRALRHPEADDVVLVNQRGELTETTTANLAVQLDGRWWTPPTTSGCLPGGRAGAAAGVGPPARARPVRPGPARRGAARGAQLAAGLAGGAAGSSGSRPVGRPGLAVGYSPAGGS